MKEKSDEKRPYNIRFIFIIGLALLIAGVALGILSFMIIGCIFICYGVVYYGKGIL